MPQSPLDLLCAARERIADPAHWTQGAHARLAPHDTLHSGNATIPDDPLAVCWCADGALIRECQDMAAMQDAADLLDRYSIQQNSRSFVSTNDTLGHRAILEIFDKAIAAAQGHATARAQG